MKENKRPRRLTSRHHKTPSSRGGSNNLENITKIDGRDHRNFHNLFGNMTPVETINYLVTYFWNGDSSYVDKYLKEYST